MSYDSIKIRWCSLCKELNVEAVDKNATDRWWKVLEVRHKGKGRHYHTMDHLVEMFEWYDKHSAEISDTAAVMLAIFFHDVVYDAHNGSPQNEMDSVALFERFGHEAIPAGDPPGRAKGDLMVKVSRWIIQTAHHRCAAGDELDCKLFMDFDMAVLGKPWEQYEEYSKKIRREYAHVPEIGYAMARKSFLETLSGSTTPIYSSDAIRESLEKQARSNLSQEATQLGENLGKFSAMARLVARASSRCKPAVKVLMYAKRLRKPKFALAVLVILALLLYFRRVVFYIFLLGMIMTLCYLIKLFFSSPYVRYPYPEPTARKGVAVIAGSYNPPHNGHLEMIKHLSKTHACVHAVVAVNPNKTYEVNAYERQELLKAMIKELELKGVQVVVRSGIVFNYARSLGAKVMYRGIRSWAQDGCGFQSLFAGSVWAQQPGKAQQPPGLTPGRTLHTRRSEKYLEAQNIFFQLLAGYMTPIPTAYLQAPPALSGISSTLLRERIAQDKDVSDIVPPGCAEMVVRAYKAAATVPKTDMEKKVE